MSWSNAQSFGVIKISGGGKRVDLYYSRDNYNSIYLNDEVKDARWAGDAVVVYLINGKIRRYTSFLNYLNIRV